MAIHINKHKDHYKVAPITYKKNTPKLKVIMLTKIKSQKHTEGQ